MPNKNMNKSNKDINDDMHSQMSNVSALTKSTGAKKSSVHKKKKSMAS
jgi:hypothetical protein